MRQAFQTFTNTSDDEKTINKKNKTLATTSVDSMLSGEPSIVVDELAKVSKTSPKRDSINIYVSDDRSKKTNMTRRS